MAEVCPHLASEHALHLSRTLFQEADTALLIVDLGTEQIVDANPLANRLTGLSTPEFEHVPVRALIRQAEGGDGCLPRALQDVKFAGHEPFLLRSGQSETWIPVTLSILSLGDAGGAQLALFVMRDRRPQLAANRRLRRTERELRRVLTSVSDCLWSCRIDRRGHWRYRYLSPVVQKITGRTAELIPRDPRQWWEMVAPGDLARWRQFHERLGSGESGDLEYRLIKSDGHLAWVRESVIVTKLDDDGAYLLHGVLTDVTQHKQVERARSDSHMLEAQKLESLGVLAGGIAHDFNNLLTGILGHASLARLAAPANAALASHLDQVETIAMRAADLCKQMLAYAGKARFVIETTDLNQLIVQTTELLKLTISKNATLNFQLAPQLPTVLADATQMRQILMNLVINASEALADKKGEIRVVTGLKQVHRDLGRGETETTHDTSQSGIYTKVVLPADDAPELPSGDYVFLEVTDTGSGMTPEVKGRIFDPFFTTKFTGRGLGLAAVLGIVRSHQGAIQVESEPGRGTTFRIFLLSNAGDVVRPRPRTPPPPTWKGEGTLLLVDDENSVRGVTAAMAESFGFAVVSAADGEEALRLFREHADKIHVVLLDLTMPRMGGEETLKELRRLQPDIPIVLMSGYSELDARGRFPEEGPTDFLQKPFRRAELMAVLRKATATP